MLFGRIATSSQPSSPASFSTSTSFVFADSWLSAIFRYSHRLTIFPPIGSIGGICRPSALKTPRLPHHLMPTAHSLLARFFPRNVPFSLLCLPCCAKRTHKL